jgi:transposase
VPAFHYPASRLEQDRLTERRNPVQRPPSTLQSAWRALPLVGSAENQPRQNGHGGSKLHLAVEGGGLPLSLLVTGANTNDSLVFEALLDDLPAVRTPAGRRRRRPECVHADKAYDHRRCRGYLSRRGIKVRIARCGIESSQRLGRHRWKAERTIAWLAGCRRLRIRYERGSERFFAFAMLACARLGYNRLSWTAEAHARSP